jgi:rhomboid domain-containing protein 1
VVGYFIQKRETVVGHNPMFSHSLFVIEGVLHSAIVVLTYYNVTSILQFMLWDNLILSNFYHWNEVHLFSNMTSLLWMGRMLETHMGSAEFTSMIVILLGLSESIAALLSRCLAFLGDDMAYFDHYSVGFSGVLFGMEAVLGTCADSLFARIPGRVIPAKCAVWAELFLTQALIPKSSFIGHLGGLLAGYIYIWLKNMFKGRDPCTLLISGGARVVTSQVRFAQKLLSSMPQGHKTGGHRVGCHSPARECPPGLWRCSTCTSYNSLATDVCEMCSTMREDRNGEVSVEEMRRRRLDRFDR